MKLQIAELSGNSQELEKLKKENELQKLVNDRITKEEKLRKTKWEKELTDLKLQIRNRDNQIT